MHDAQSEQSLACQCPRASRQIAVRSMSWEWWRCDACGHVWTRRRWLPMTFAFVVLFVVFAVLLILAA